VEETIRGIDPEETCFCRDTCLLVTLYTAFREECKTMM